MKQYGANKATEFTKKQINVVYGCAKRGDIKVEKWVMKEFYDLAEYYGYDDNRNVESSEVKILAMLKAIFSRDYAEAQRIIDEYSSQITLYGKKFQQNANHELVA